MHAIQMRRPRQRNEELASIRTRPAVRHRENALTRMGQGVVKLVFELTAPDGLAATARAGGVAALDHEVWDDAVEDHAVGAAGVGEAGEVGTGL